MPHKNIEERKEYHRNYYKKHKQEFLDKANKWYDKNKRRASFIKKASHARKILKDKNMTADVVQKVYEENIKRHGTLTCVVCNKPIRFGDDNLEHDVPLKRGGTHCFENLGVAHHGCNVRKRKKTLAEYHKGVPRR